VPRLYPRTFRVGSTANFVWSAPEPVNVVGVNLTIGAYSVAMNQVISDVTIVAGGVSTDRTVLTASLAPAIGDGALSRFGDAFLITVEGEVYPVRVLRIDDTAILLANPLPVSTPLTAPAVLQFTTWGAAVGPGNVTAAVDYQGTEWSVAYTRNTPVELAYDQGLVKVVRVVWQSGLDTARLIRMFPSLQNLGHYDASYTAQIDAAHTVLAARIDTDVSSYTTASGERATIDDVESQNAALELVHAHIAAGHIYADRQDFEQYEHHFTRAFGTESSVDLRRKTGLYADAMRPIWVDLDRDGAVDDGEIEDVAGPGPGAVASGFPSTPRVSVTRQR